MKVDPKFNWNTLEGYILGDIGIDGTVILK
jgi:hypothetical protein